MRGDPRGDPRDLPRDMPRAPPRAEGGMGPEGDAVFATWEPSQRVKDLNKDQIKERNKPLVSRSVKQKCWPPSDHSNKWRRVL